MTASVKVILYTDDRNDRASVECVLRILFGAKAPHEIPCCLQLSYEVTRCM